MVADGGLSDSDRPDPTRLSTAADFVDAMRRLKLWTGWGYRRLEKNAAAAGQALPRSTVTFALSRTTLPREELVAAFARACGCDEDQTERWVAARRRIAAASHQAPQPTVAGPPAEVRPRRRAWPVRTAVILLVFAVAATIVGTLLRKGDPTTSDQGQPPPAQPGQDRTQTTQPTPGTTAPTPDTPPTDPDRPTAPATTTTSPIRPIIPPPPGGPAPNIPTRPTITVPRPSTTTTTTTPTTPITPTRETIQLPDGQTIDCPLPYVDAGSGPLAQCTMWSGDQASIGLYNPETRAFSPTWNNLRIFERTWYDAPTLASKDNLYARTRGFASMETIYGAAVWATQYRDGQARYGIFNLVTDRFQPHTEWLPAAG